MRMGGRKGDSASGQLIQGAFLKNRGESGGGQRELRQNGVMERRWAWNQVVAWTSVQLLTYHRTLREWDK